MFDFRVILFLFVAIGCVSNQKTTALDYNRSTWPHWLDEDSDCQNTRAEVLIKSSEVPVKGRCVVRLGRWFDPYLGRIYTKANKLDIDHIVPLKHASTHGAEFWDRNKKARFANDPFNLLAVDRGANRSKGAKGPNEWMPPNKDFGCFYVQRWMSVKVLYGLEISEDEREFLFQYVKKCN